jgi:thiamine biosynthesis lipoprotein
MPVRTSASSSELLRLQQSSDAMGSTFSVVLYGSDRRRMEEAANAAFDEVRRLDALLSSYRPESEWSLVNREAAHHPAAISAELCRLLSVCLEHSRLTDGAFDITVGPLQRAWGFFRGTGSVPPAEVLVEARRHVGYQFVQFDVEARAVRFDHPGVEIDPGGIGKGYAVDRMVEVLRKQGFDTALVAGSGSSLYGLGCPPSKSLEAASQPVARAFRPALAGLKTRPTSVVKPAVGWRTEIRDPEHPGKCVDEAALKNMSLSTSGTGEKCFWSEGIMYSHIIDPRTGWPLQSISQVSVVAPSALDGEVWAKACLLNGPQWTRENKPSGFRILFRTPDRAQQPIWL